MWIVAGSLFLGVYLVVQFGDSLGGFGIIAGSGALAALGIWYVNQRYEAVLEAGIEQAQSAILDVVRAGDGDSEVSSIPIDGRALLLVNPARAYDLTTLVAGDDSFAVHEDTTVNLAHRYVSVGDDAHHYEYTELSSVSYEDGRLHVTKRDGAVDSYAMSSAPTSAMSAARERIAAVENHH